MRDFKRVHPTSTLDFNLLSAMPIPSFRPSACAILCLALLAACSGEEGKREVAGGDAGTGRQLVAQYQCGACHKIPETRGAGGEAGPDLDGFGKLSYIAGRIPNQPDRLVAWLMDPPALKPGTAMPAMGLTEQEARHMAAFLYTLK
jgi:cytochrome c